MLVSCGSAPLYQHNELARQIIRPRTGYEGRLTNQTCLKYERGECEAWSVRTVDMLAPESRQQLVRFDFVCKMAGRRFHPCEDKPGFCHRTYNCTWLELAFGACAPDVEFVPMSPYQALIDADLKCFSERAYSWDEIK